MKYYKNIGGFRSIWYTIKIGREVGYLKMLRTLVSKNTCKTCALGYLVNKKKCDQMDLHQIHFQLF